MLDLDKIEKELAPGPKILALTYSTEYPVNITEIRDYTGVDMKRLQKILDKDMKNFVDKVVRESGRIPKDKQGNFEKGHSRGEFCRKCIGSCKKLNKILYHIKDSNIDGKKEALYALNILMGSKNKKVKKFLDKMISMMPKKRRNDFFNQT